MIEFTSNLIKFLKCVHTLQELDILGGQDSLLRISTNATPKITTGITQLPTGSRVVSVRYCSLSGLASERPWPGVNIVTTSYSDGSTTTHKVMR